MIDLIWAIRVVTFRIFVPYQNKTFLFSFILNQVLREKCEKKAFPSKIKKWIKLNRTSHSKEEKKIHHFVKSHAHIFHVIQNVIQSFEYIFFKPKTWSPFKTKPNQIQNNKYLTDVHVGKNYNRNSNFQEEMTSSSLFTR